MKTYVLLLLAFGICSFGQPVRTTHVYKTVEGHEIRVDVIRPPGERVRPVIFWLHGGALINGSRANLNAEQLRRYLDAGFAVAAIDYRLAPEAKLASILEDVRDAHLWLRREGRKLLPIDPDRLVVVGHSAGGYLTLMTGTLLKPVPKALVSYYGYGDIAGEWYSRPDPFYSRQPAVSEEEARRAVGATPVSEPPSGNQRFRFYLYCRQRGLWPKEVTGRDPESEPRAFDPWCPVRNVTRPYPPTMLLHGDADTDVPYRQSVLMAEQFKAKGVKHEFITIPGGPHGFDRAMDKPEISGVFDRALQFLKDHVNP
jgi:acetyl esterase/lipase